MLFYLIIGLLLDNLGIFIYLIFILGILLFDLIVFFICVGLFILCFLFK